MFDNNAVTETHNNLRDSVERVHGPIDDGEFFRDERPTMTQGLFELG